MFKTTIKIEGMMCGMCETHVADAIRKAFPDAHKVSASHSKNEAIFLTENEPDETLLKSTVDETGYTFISSTTEPYRKKVLGIF